MSTGASEAWAALKASLVPLFPRLVELEPGGPMALELGHDGWLLELTPDGKLLCQYGMALDDVMTLLSDGTPEDLGTDELAKQAKYYLQPAVAKVRKAFQRAGFEEATEMTDEYVAVTFQRDVDFEHPEEVARVIGWCQAQFKKP